MFNATTLNLLNIMFFSTSSNYSIEIVIIPFSIIGKMWKLTGIFKIMIYEICIDSVDSAIAAQCEGADRVELCANLSAGGTTPSYGMIKSVRESIDIVLFVMIRPREGNFIYSDFEFDCMKSDIEAAKELGADGVVFGLLQKDNSVNIERTLKLLQLARPMEVTFHRAFDHCVDPKLAFHRLKEIGVDRILTSGQKATAIDGCELIKELLLHNENKIKILAGSGINSSNVKQLINKTGVSEVHFTCHKLNVNEKI